MIRLKFVHTKAVRDRWDEEHKLLHEEVRRLGETFAHDARGWRLKGAYVSPSAWTLAEDDGYRAYCREQAVQFEKMSAEAIEEHRKLD